ncbi:hypothetical protein PT974_04473 [Cladobotryum mycophilum]|uniref:Uncharacterized protein n=1 Tax=Cladobotryum mycophilum TaxID=491253 RepID=A0ABR0SVX4_9HYPO
MRTHIIPAKKEFQKTGKPISHGKIFIKALLVALIVGIVLEIISACTGSDNQYQDVENPQNTEYIGAGPPAFEAPQAPMPIMGGNGFWTPLHNAAADLAV